MSDNQAWKDLDEMIGRVGEIKDIKEAFKRTGVNIIYLIGEGGMGKTRMLRYMIDNPTEFCKDGLFPDKYVDLYHIENHSEQGLIESLIDRFSPDHESEFKPVRDILTDLQDQPLISASAGEHEGKVTKLKDTFIKTLKTLGEKQEIVLLFDTGESWAVENYETSAKKWLFDELITKLTEATIVFAGRPEILEEMKFGRKIDDGTIVSLGNLASEDSIEFIDAVIKQNLYNMEGFDYADKELLSEACQGNPIRLSLYVQMYATAGEDQKKELKKLVAKQQSMEEFDAKIIGQLLADADTTEPLLWLGAARKGLTAKLLAVVNIDDEEAAKATLESLSEKVFVKVFSEEGDEPTYFLHDLIRDMMEKHAYSKEDLWYRYGRLAEAIKNTERNLSPDSNAFIESLVYDTILDENFENQVEKLIIDLKEKSQQSESRRSNILFYMFRDPREGQPAKALRHFIRYFHDSHENKLFTARELIRQEWSRHINSPGHADGAVFEILKWIGEIFEILKQIEAEKDPEKQKEIQAKEFEGIQGEIQKSCLHEYLKEILITFFKVWQANLIISDFDAAGKILSPLEALLGESEPIIPKEFEENECGDIIPWFLRYLAGFWRRLWGYLERTDHKYKEAVENYNIAITIAEDIDLQTEVIIAKTNLAFAESNLGLYGAAEKSAKEAIEASRKRGQASRLGFAINTLATIYNAYGGTPDGPNKAKRLSQSAMDVFETTKDWRGQALSILANAEAMRRLTPHITSVQDKIENLEKARDILKELKNRFNDAFEKSKEDERSEKWILLHIELGCDYRDLVQLLSQKIYYEESKDNLKEAKKEAEKEVEKEKDNFQVLNALVNLAWLEYYYYKDTDIFNQKIDTAIKNAAEAAENVEEIKEKTKHIAWSHQAKLETLKGLLNVDRWLGSSDDQFLSEAVKGFEEAKWINETMFTAEFRASKKTEALITDLFDKFKSDQQKRAFCAAVADFEGKDKRFVRKYSLKKLLTEKGHWIE